MRKTGALALLTGTTLAMGLATGHLARSPKPDAGVIRRNDDGQLETAAEIEERENPRPFSAATLIESVYGVPVSLEWRDDEQKPSPYEVLVDQLAIVALGATAVGSIVLSCRSIRDDDGRGDVPEIPTPTQAL